MPRKYVKLLTHAARAVAASMRPGRMPRKYAKHPSEHHPADKLQ